MKTIKHGLKLVACSVALGLSASSFAASGTAALDWSAMDLSITGIGGGIAPTVSFFDIRTALSSSADFPNVSSETNDVTTFNWTSFADTQADASPALTAAVGSPLSLSGSAQATRAIVTSGFLPLTAGSQGTRSAEFVFDGPGVLTISIPYSLSVIGHDLDFLEHASALVQGNALFFGEDFSFSQSSAFFRLESLFGGSASRSGTLVIGIVAGSPGSGQLQLGFDVSAQAIGLVPEPSTYLMMFAGVAMIALRIRRRRSLPHEGNRGAPCM